MKTWAWALVFLLTFLFWFPSAGNDFTYDDRPAAMGKQEHGINHSIRDKKPLSHYFSSSYWESYSKKNTLYRPITVLSYALRYRLFGDNPLPAHLFNIFLASLGAVLVFWLLRILQLGIGWSVAGALVFSTHALHTEVVANVVGRAELFAFDFGLSACLILIIARTKQGAGAGLLRLFGAGLFFLAFCSKENALNWLPFLPLLALCLHQLRPRGTPILDRKLPFETLAALIPALLFFFLRGKMISHLPPGPDLTINWTSNPLFFASPESRILSAILMEGWGFLQTFAPFWLSADYGPHVAPVAPSLSSPTGMAALIVGVLLLSILGAGVAQWRKRPQLFLAAGIFFSFSFLTSNIAFPIGTVYGERLMFGPSLGFAIFLAYMGSRLPPKATPAGILALGLWLGASGIVGLKRQSVWKNNQVLFLHEVAEHPESIKMQLCAGQEWLLRNDFEKALIHFRQGVTLDPKNPSAWNLFGVALLNLDRTREAEVAFLRALRGRKRDLLLHRSAIERNLTLVRKKDQHGNRGRAKAPR